MARSSLTTRDAAHMPLQRAAERDRRYFNATAVALGWTDADLFGCDDIRPYARIDRMGLVWLLNGRRVVAVTADTAAIETESGTQMTFRRSLSQA
jgi:hypothetical protein